MKSGLLGFLLLVPILVRCGGPSPDPRESGPVVGPSHAPRGSSVGNGGEDLPDDFGGAWFLGPQEIRYCYEIGPGFGVSRESIEATLETAFRQWRAYLVQKRVNDPLLWPERERLPENSRLVFNSRLVGDCRKDADLVFYLGVDNERVRAQRENHVRPLSFAAKSPPADRAGPGGFVWVAPPGSHSPRFPDWSQEGHLLSIVLHELGHVLGCGHVEGTVMNANPGKILRDSLGERSASPGSFPRTIDWKRELLFCPGCRSKVYVGVRAGVEGGRFSRLVPPSEGVSYRAKLALFEEGRGRITIEWERGAEHVPSPESSELFFLREAREESPVFKIALVAGDGSLHTFQSHTTSRIYLATASPGRGNLGLVSINKPGDYFLLLDLFLGGGSQFRWSFSPGSGAP